MALAHEHILSCQPCNTPLLLTGLLPTPATTRAVLLYQHTIAAILAGTCTNAPSHLQPMAEDNPLTPTTTTATAAAATSLHVLHLDGLDRAAFAAHCGLDAAVLEAHFATLSRLTGARLGRCWCACHAAGADGRRRDGLPAEEFVPASPEPVVGQRVLLRDIEEEEEDGSDELDGRGGKRKRWSSAEAGAGAVQKRRTESAETLWLASHVGVDF